MREWVEAVFRVIADLREWGIMLGLMIEVIPSELVLSFGGYLVSQGHISFVGAVVFGTIGGTLAQIFVYWFGRYGGRPFLERYGKYIFIQKKHIDLSEQWFERYGSGVIFTARFVPVVRHAISIPAGISRMSISRFTLLTTLAILPWTIFFVYLGLLLGEHWQEIDQAAEPYIFPVVITSGWMFCFYLIYKLVK